MATRKPKPKAEPLELPALGSLPDVPMDHPVLHNIVNIYVGGTCMTKIAAKLDLPFAYIKGVIHHFLTRYE